MKNSNGLFIVVEGLDKSGKTTIVNKLHDVLSISHPVARISFPDRSSLVGQTIDKYLKGDIKLPVNTTHLLFTADRYAKNEFIQNLRKDHIVVCDRYSWSGITSTVAKGGCFEWCMETERLLEKPDLTVYLYNTVDVLSKRRGFGDEVLETREMQEKIKVEFDKMHNYVENVLVVDGNLHVDKIVEKVVYKINNMLFDRSRYDAMFEDINVKVLAKE